MISNRSMLDVADNRRAKRVQCLKVLGGSTSSRYAAIGNIKLKSNSGKKRSSWSCIKKGRFLTQLSLELGKVFVPL